MLPELRSRKWTSITLTKLHYYLINYLNCPEYMNPGYWSTTPELFLPPATKLGQGYVFTGVCHSVNRGEYLTPPQDLEQTPPGTWSRHPPPGPGTPPGTRYTPPGTRYTPGARYTPGPGTPQDQVHPPGQVHPRDQVHPLGPGTPPRRRACWEIRSMSGRYASYWNAILFV